MTVVLLCSTKRTPDNGIFNLPFKSKIAICLEFTETLNFQLCVLIFVCLSLEIVKCYKFQILVLLKYKFLLCEKIMQFYIICEILILSYSLKRTSSHSVVYLTSKKMKICYLNHNIMGLK